MLKQSQSSSSMFFKSKTNKAIMALTLPAIVSNLTTPILGLVDVAIVGHIGNAVYIGAIAVGGAMFSMLYWLFGFLRMGTGGPTAQALGAGKGTETVLYRALLVGAAVALIMLVLQVPLQRIILRFMDADDQTSALAGTYFSIGIWGAPAVMCTYGVNGWLIGMQNTKAMMWVAIVTDISNILLSLLFVFGLGFDIKGVAAGTVCAQWIGFIMGATIIWTKYHPVKRTFKEIFHLEAFKQFFSINTDIFLRTICLVAVTVWFTHAGAIQSPDVLAVNSILMQFFLLFSYFMDGFAYAGEALSGKLLGAGQIRQMHQTIHVILLWGVALSLIFSALYFIGGDMALGWLTDDPNVRMCAKEYVWWAVTFPVAGFAAFIWDGVFIGTTLTRRMLVAMIIATGAFFGLYFALFPSMGNHGLWLAFIVYLLLRGIVQHMLFNIKEGSQTKTIKV